MRKVDLCPKMILEGMPEEGGEGNQHVPTEIMYDEGRTHTETSGRERERELEGSEGEVGKQS